MLKNEKKRSRDDFKEPVINLLRARVANRCSNPNCRRVTSGPAGVNKISNTGIAAHIEAASKGGPRYNEHMSSDQRAAFDNGIWLCSICATKVDRDIDLYTVTVLKDWKQQAEQKALEENGSILPDMQEVHNTIKSALTGFPLKVLSTSISNIHQVNTSILEELDPRFCIQSSFINGVTIYNLSAKETVPFSIDIKNDANNKHAIAFQGLWEEGKDVCIDMANIKITGSKLLEQICEEGSSSGKLMLSAKKTKAVQKVWLVNKVTKQIETFDDVYGEISSGTKSLSFKGSACNGLVEFELKVNKAFEENILNVILSINYESWQNRQIIALPYFEKLHSLYIKLCEGWEFFTSLEVEGQRLFTSTGVSMSHYDFVINNGNFLNYTMYCRTISSKLNQNVYFVAGTSLRREDISDIYDISEILLGSWNSTDPSKVNSFPKTIELTYDNSGVIAALSNTKSMELEFQGEIQEVKLFETVVKVPPLRVRMNPVMANVLTNLESATLGETLEVEWLPQENFKCIYEFMF